MYEVPFLKWLSVCQNIEEYIPVLVIGSDVSQEIGAVDLAAICVAVLRSVLEYNVAWLDITPFLPICLVQ